MTTGPTAEATIERALSFASEAMLTIDLQIRRLGTVEPEDTAFLFRPWVDWQFLAIALNWLRRSAALAQRHLNDEHLAQAIAAFDRDLPQIRRMRNSREHFDAYAEDRGRDAQVGRGHLQVGSWDSTGFEWLGDTLRTTTAQSASESLLAALRLAASRARAS